MSARVLVKRIWDPTIKQMNACAHNNSTDGEC